MTNIWIFPGSSDSKASATRQETQVQSLGQEDLLKKEMATRSGILVWEIPWTETWSFGPWGCKRVEHDLTTKQEHFAFMLI